jgi:hypothetical protein
MTTESQRYNCFIRDGGNAIPKHACPEAGDSIPTAGLTLLWACNPFRGSSSSWQVSQEEAGRIILLRLGNKTYTETSKELNITAVLGKLSE